MEEPARRRKKEAPRRHMPDRESRQGTAAGYAGGRGVTKRCFPLSFRKAGNIFIIAYYRSFLSSSSTEYGIARLPQPVPMEMCVLRVPW